ncbi:uncharacterized protein LOC130779778 isoform X1 [Actinidia eriantha]|uniref:uncharacterized protein LOC130779778 isoform X1 n=1 Tax=Actinidia eriantha TaxID=165200 RepID=UPI002584F193|nr:uncharacterized protein LOC130779778 isoform X1 [Actinidia eriantha]
MVSYIFGTHTSSDIFFSLLPPFSLCLSLARSTNQYTSQMYSSSSSFRNLLYRFLSLSLSQVSASSRTVISQGDCYQLKLRNCISQFVTIILYVYVFICTMHIFGCNIEHCVVVVVVLQENVDSFASLNFSLLIIGRKTSINGLLWIFFSRKMCHAFTRKHFKLTNSLCYELSHESFIHDDVFSWILFEMMHLIQVLEFCVHAFASASFF